MELKKPVNSILGKDRLLELYKMMLLIRYCEESLVEPILRNEIKCPCHLCSGQEAIPTGICASLTSSDYVFGNHRSHGHFLAKGGDLNSLIAEIYGKETGCSRGRGGSMHLIDPEVGFLGSAPIVAGTVSLAVGAALASSIRGDDSVSVSFFGDGACGEGVVFESMNFASVRQLPVIFVCENNLYATHMPIRDCRTDQNISRIAEPFCISSFTVDGNDVLSVFDVGSQAIQLCRSGNGPVFIECLTYRYRGHVGPDDNVQGQHTDIRPHGEVEEWLAKDPVTRFELFLKENSFLDDSSLAKLKQNVEKQVLDAHEFAKASPFPSPEDLLKYVFTDSTAKS